MNKKAIFVFSCFLAAFVVSSCGFDSVAVKKDYDFKKIKRVAVLDFQDAAGYYNSGSTVSGMFTKYILKAGFSVVERDQLQSILKEHQLFMDGVINPDQVKEFGRLSGVDALIAGSVSELIPERNFYDNGYPRFIAAQVAVACRMIDIETGEILWVASDSYDGTNTQTAFEYLISSLVSDFARAIRKK